MNLRRPSKKKKKIKIIKINNIVITINNCFVDRHHIICCYVLSKIKICFVMKFPYHVGGIRTYFLRHSKRFFFIHHFEFLHVTCHVLTVHDVVIIVCDDDAVSMRWHFLFIFCLLLR